MSHNQGNQGNQDADTRLGSQQIYLPNSAEESRGEPLVRAQGVNTSDYVDDVAQDELEAELRYFYQDHRALRHKCGVLRNVCRKLSSSLEELHKAGKWSESDYERLMQLIQRLIHKSGNLRSKVKSLERSLEESKAELFKLQPRDSFPDTDIATEYEVLSQYVGQWVDGLFATLEKEAIQIQPLQYLLALLQMDDENKDATIAIAEIPSTAEVLIHAAIFQVLHDNIFNVSLFGINERHLDGSKMMEKGMAEFRQKGNIRSNPILKQH